MSISKVKKRKKILVKIPYIFYLIQFKKDATNIKVFLDVSRKVHIITFMYALKINFCINYIKMIEQKTYRSIFATLILVVACFYI